MESSNLRHVDTTAPRVMVVDGSRLVRKLIGDVLAREVADIRLISCGSIKEARAALEAGPVDLVTTALSLPDGDGITLARTVREASGQSYVPIIVISGDAQAHLESRRFTEDVTDYFDKALGHSALAAFIRGYVQPQPIPGARVLYVEDSRVVALATKRMLERHGMTVLHFNGAEEALEHLEAHRGQDDTGADLVLTDVYLKGELSGHDLLARLRSDFGYGKRRLPVLVMTGDANPDNQSGLLRAGANDLVLKPIEERLLVTKALFQLRLSRLPEQRSFHA
ncbi:response regulator [Lysobacter sp. D1-1-M9]|uniref:response regulator n=1 Tax=Novilysobacter longmucuonensis TaxID=3098603 RepID=UPI002FCA5816